jgi:hypothetical protein
MIGAHHDIVTWAFSREQSFPIGCRMTGATLQLATNTPSPILGRLLWREVFIDPNIIIVWLRSGSQPSKYDIASIPL